MVFVASKAGRIARSIFRNYSKNVYGMVETKPSTESNTENISVHDVSDE